MKILKPRTLGVFGRTYAMMLGTVLLSELLIFSAVIVSAPPIPPIIEYPSLVASLSDDPGEMAQRLTRRIAKESGIDRPADEYSISLGRAMDRSLGLPSGSIRVQIGLLGPPSAFGSVTAEELEKGKMPFLVAGEFTLARPLKDGTWLILETDGSFASAAALRFALLLMGTLALVVPCAYILAHRMTRPISNFAHAADRLGRDPHAPPMPETGPREVRVASEAFNRMQRRLNSYIEERTTMVAAVAHDLRTPLMRMAFEIEDAPPKLHDALSRQIDEMSEMTDAIMRFLQAEQSRHERRLCDISNLLRDIVAEFQDDGHDVYLEGTQVPLIMDGDAIGIKSVLRNVIGNAVTYGNSAHIMLTKQENQAVIKVHDQGPGLAEADIERVFQPFYRVEKSRNRKTGGIGLGLAVTRSIVVAHGGSIVLANAEGSGLVATVSLPVR
jgi:two-component system, OmpR family, sensor kinase